MSLSWCGPWRSAMSVRKPSVVFWFLVFLLCSTGSTSQSLPATDQAEKTALVALRDAISNSRSTLGTWFSGDPCNGWSGVFCTQEDYPDELKSSTSSHVTELRLLNHNLVGTLDKAVGDLKALKILDVMWNNLTGSIPDTLGNIKTLELLLLNGNKFDGPLPDSLGNLVNLDRLQIDENHFSGPVPTSFQKLSSVEHLHMNNNSLSGPIPPELGSLPRLVHLLLDNNKLTGKLPEELANISTLMILQLDNNTFDANTTIPPAYLQMPSLLKLSLRSCNLVGQIPGEISSPKLGVLDLSENRLNGTIPDFPPEAVLTAIDLSVNNLSGPIPSSIGELGNLSYILLNHNNITGSVPDSLGSVALYDDPGARFIWDFQDNGITSWPNSASLIGKANSDFLFAGNPLCDNQIAANCQPQSVNEVLQIGTAINASTNKGSACLPCEGNFQLIPDAENAIEKCRCAVPIIIWYRLKSPGFSLFDLYELSFKSYIASGLKISVDQVEIKDYTYEPGPRLSMHLLLFPSTGNYFNTTEVTRISNEFAQWTITDSNIYGPYELLKFTAGVDPSSSESSGLAAGAIAGIVLGVLLAVALFLVILYMYFMLQKQKRKPVPPLRTRYRHTGTFSKIKATGLAEFTWEEMEQFTSKFSDANVLGVGGFGKVYMGVLEDGTKVAIKRAGMAVGSDEQFETEIELLSRVHHRHLVGLKGFCIDDDSGDKFLVYEFMANGSVEDHLPPHSTSPLDFPTRVRVALGAAKGLNYLHTEANPPIYHRDIKASNILLDEKFNAKVSDFGVSKNAPELDEEGNQGGGVDTLVKGTPGYLDPEYCLTHTLTDKSDVYSFGVLLMVLLTGKQAITQGKNIVRHVTMAMANDEEMIVSLVDTYIAHQCPVDIAEAWARLAIRCTKEDPLDRPSMTEVVRELETISKDCNMFRAETPSSSNPSTFTTMTSTDGTTQSSSDTREWPDPKTSAVYESHPSAVNLMSDYDGRTSQSKP